VRSTSAGIVAGLLVAGVLWVVRAQGYDIGVISSALLLVAVVVMIRRRYSSKAL
jgi:hypothetical protein